MRTIWNGSLCFGLVNIPVGLALATSPRRASPTSRSGRCTRSARRRSGRSGGARHTSARSGPTRSSRDGRCRRGVPHRRGRRSRSDPVSGRLAAIDITAFVPLDRGRPDLLRPHLLPRARERAAQRGALRAAARGDEGDGNGGGGAIRPPRQGDFCLIRARGDALAARDPFLHEDVRSQAEIEEAVDDDGGQGRGARPRAAGDRRARGDFEPESWSEYRRDLRAMLEAKLAGEEIAKPEPAPEAPVVDLMEALRRTVAGPPERRRQPAASRAKTQAAAREGRRRIEEAPARRQC